MTTTVTYHAFRLHFSSPLHLARGKSDYAQSDLLLHSDTLKSALFVCALQLFGKQSIEHEKAFFDGFTVSSAFPFFKGEYFFPKPMVRLQSLEGIPDEKQGKPLKKIQFLGKSYWEDLLSGGKFKIQQSHLFEGGKYVSNHPDILAQSGYTIIRSQIQQRVSIPFDNAEEPTTYYVDRLFFANEAGLYFLLQCRDENLYAKIRASVQLLGDSGVGMDKTVGNGQFTVEDTKIVLHIPSRATHQLNLSLYCPEATELTDKILAGSSYNLTKRGGYIANPRQTDNLTLRKRSVYMFNEGSVFATDQSLIGKLIDLKPDIPLVDHPVWRDGRALFVPIQPQEDDTY